MNDNHSQDRQLAAEPVQVWVYQDNVEALVNYPPLSSKTRSSGGLRFQVSLARSFPSTDRFGPVDLLRRIFAVQSAHRLKVMP
jgi:hypothetical protein